MEISKNGLFIVALLLTLSVLEIENILEFSSPDLPVGAVVFTANMYLCLMTPLFCCFFKTQVQNEENIPAHARGKRNCQYDHLVSLRMKSEGQTH